MRRPASIYFSIPTTAVVSPMYSQVEAGGKTTSVQTFLALFIPLVLLWGVYKGGQALNRHAGVQVVSGGSVFAAILVSWPLLLGVALLAEGDTQHREATEFLLATGAAVAVLLLWRNLSHSGSGLVSFAALAVQLVLAIPALPLVGLVLFGLHSLFFA